MANPNKNACEQNLRAVEIANWAKAGEVDKAHALLIEQVLEIWKQKEPVGKRITETNQLLADVVCLDPKDIKVVQAAKGGGVDLEFHLPKPDPTDKEAKAIAGLLALNKIREAEAEFKSYSNTVILIKKKSVAQREHEMTRLAIDLKCLDPTHVSITKMDNRGIISGIRMDSGSDDANDSTPLLKT